MKEDKKDQKEKQSDNPTNNPNQRAPIQEPPARDKDEKHKNYVNHF